MKLFYTTPPDTRTGFRLPKELLSTIDSICDQCDLTRSQVFRKSITQFIKSLDDERSGQTPNSLPEDPQRTWLPEFYDRLQRKK